MKSEDKLGRFFSFCLIFTLTLLIKCFFSNAIVKANNIEMINIDNSGGKKALSINEYYGIEGCSGVNADGGQELWGGYYYAKNRYTSLPQHLPQNGRWSISIFLAGYPNGQYGAEYYGTEDVDLYYENSKGKWEKFDTVTIGGYVESNGPHFTLTSTKVYSVDSFTNLPSTGLWKIRGHVTGHCLDIMKITAYYNDAPYYVDDDVYGYQYKNGNDYWFKSGNEVTLRTHFKDDYTDLAQTQAVLKQNNAVKYSIADTSGKGLTILQSNSAMSNEKIYFEGVNERNKATQYKFTITGDEDYDYTIDCYNTAGEWLRNKDGTPKDKAIDTGKNIRVDSQGPTAEGYRIENKTTTSYEVYIDNVTDERSGVAKVYFPTWTKEDQSDIKWLTGTRVDNSNTWKITVNASEFNNAIKGYITHIYAEDNVGNLRSVACCQTINFQPELLSLINTYRVSSLNNIDKSPISAPVSLPISIFREIKTGLQVNFNTTNLVELEFYYDGDKAANGIKFSSENSELVKYNGSIDKFDERNLSAGDNTSDNKVTMKVSETATNAKLDFILPKDIPENAIISVKVKLYNDVTNISNDSLGENFFKIRENVISDITINNIR